VLPTQSPDQSPLDIDPQTENEQWLQARLQSYVEQAKQDVDAHADEHAIIILQAQYYEEVHSQLAHQEEKINRYTGQDGYRENVGRAGEERQDYGSGSGQGQGSEMGQAGLESQ